MALTLDDVKKSVEEIRASAGDDEAAHILEDGLHEEVLRAIAEGALNAADLAAEALKTTEIDFARWCA